MARSKDEMLPAKRSSRGIATQDADGNIPAIIEAAGNAARFAFEEFIFGKLRNVHTRKA